MKCPLSKNILEEGSYPPEMEFKDCLKEKCAWWDSANICCSILSLNIRLLTISASLGDIAEKMPHEGQFRK